MDTLYTDGTRVREGDRVRYRQAPGGLLPPPSDADGKALWQEGVAVKFPHGQRGYERSAARGGVDPDELHLLADNGRHYRMAPHIIERLDPL